jgi:hypothetical protein
MDKPKVSNFIEQEFSGKVTNGKETLDEFRSNQNIIEVKWFGKHRVTY